MQPQLRPSRTSCHRQMCAWRPARRGVDRHAPLRRTVGPPSTWRGDTRQGTCLFDRGAGRDEATCGGLTYRVERLVGVLVPADAGRHPGAGSVVAGDRPERGAGTDPGRPDRSGRLSARACSPGSSRWPDIGTSDIGTSGRRRPTRRCAAVRPGRARCPGPASRQVTPSASPPHPVPTHRAERLPTADTSPGLPERMACEESS
jgi:hypothetical protein